MLIDAAHSEEVRIAVVSDGKLDRFDFESRSKAQVKGNIYLAKVIRVEPSLQAAFVDYGGNRHGFLGFSDIHYDYFQIPVADRQVLEMHLKNAVDSAKNPDESGESKEEFDEQAMARIRRLFYKRYKIQEVIKKRQIMLVQVTKEERGNKGAALTTYISLAGRYCVYMPNTPRGSGISRKINKRDDRDRLKKVVSDLDVDHGSVVIRTAGIGHTKTEIKKDFNYLKSVWDEIRETTMQSTAPCLIHEEANVIKRAIRDMYTKDVDSIVVEGENGYKIARNFMKGLMPSHVKKIKFYRDSNVPLFAKYKLNEQINQIYSTRVDLPSGGYLVINNTEALVAIDVNSGRATRERNIAETALKTNLEAAAEIARQCRLRDLGGLIVVDFIDMAEKKNNTQVEMFMNSVLKQDNAKIQVGSISNFGLLEFSRQRMRPSIVDANMIICPHCRGTGLLMSEESQALHLLRRIEETSISGNYKEIVVTASTGMSMYILNNKRSFIAAIEDHTNLKIRFIADTRLADNDFTINPVIRPKSIEIDAEDHESVAEAVQEDVKNVSEELVVAEVKTEDTQEVAPNPKKHGRKKQFHKKNKQQQQQAVSTSTESAPEEEVVTVKEETAAPVVEETSETLVAESQEQMDNSENTGNSVPVEGKKVRFINKRRHNFSKKRQNNQAESVENSAEKKEVQSETEENKTPTTSKVIKLSVAKKRGSIAKKPKEEPKQGAGSSDSKQEQSENEPQAEKPFIAGQRSLPLTQRRRVSTDPQAIYEVVKTYKDVIAKATDTIEKEPPLEDMALQNAPEKKKGGWWQKLLKKPDEV